MENVIEKNKFDFLYRKIFKRLRLGFLLTVTILICLTANLCMASNLKVSDPIIFDAQQTDKFLSAVKDHLGQMNSLRANFVQERHMLVFEEPLKAEGILYYKAPGNLRWELTKPFSSVLLYVNGKVSKIVKNGAENRQLDIGSQELMRQIIGMIVGWMQGELDQSREYFNLEISRDQNYRVQLLPKAEALQKMIHSIELIMDVENYHIRKVIIKEPRGDRIEIRYLKEQWNLELLDDLFKP